MSFCHLLLFTQHIRLPFYLTLLNTVNGRNSSLTSIAVCIHTPSPADASEISHIPVAQTNKKKDSSSSDMTSLEWENNLECGCWAAFALNRRNHGKWSSPAPWTNWMHKSIPGSQSGAQPTLLVPFHSSQQFFQDRIQILITILVILELCFYG